MKKRIKIKGRMIEVEVCDSIFSKARGLMFRTKPENLLFVFEKPTRQAIHSFFCKPFKAIWMLNSRIVDEKIVKPFSLNVKPKGKYNWLIEIPLGKIGNVDFAVGDRKI